MADEDLPGTEESAVEPADIPEDVTPIANQDEREYAPRPIADEVREASADYKNRPKTKDDWIAQRLEKKLEAKYRRELSERDEKIAELARRFQEKDSEDNKAGLEADLKGLKNKRDELRQKWIDATEQGRTAEAAAINEEIGELVFDMRSTRAVMDARAASPPPRPDVNPRLAAWAADVGFQSWSEEERAIAAGIDRALTKSGMKHSDDGYYTEMARRLSHAVPDRADVIAAHAPVSDDDEDDDGAPRPRKGKKIVDQQTQTTRRLPGVAGVAGDSRAPSAGEDLPREHWAAMKALMPDRINDHGARKAFRESMVRKGYL